jgi:hypothetical protein
VNYDPIARGPIEKEGESRVYLFNMFNAQVEEGESEGSSSRRRSVSCSFPQLDHHQLIYCVCLHALLGERFF